MIALFLRFAGRTGAAVTLGGMLLVGMALGGHQAAHAETPAEFLKDFSNTALDRLSGEELSESERTQRFHGLLEKGFDVPAVSQFILARHWRAASEQEREDFVAVFKDYLAQRFLPLFAGGQGSDFSLEFGEAKPLQDRDDLFDVPVVFRPASGGEPVNTVWRVRQQGGQFKILDVRAEGVSLAVTLRDEYSSVISRQGGVGGLIEELRRLVESGQVEPAGNQS
jgi:phospholipid transport system substrate-binding protein